MMIVGGERMMADLEKVLHGLSSCGNDYGIPNICEVTECPYREDKAWCVHELAYDAGILIAELLKAQKPVEPKKVKRYIDFDGEGHPYIPEAYDCGACGNELSWKTNYCPMCGQAVKWE